MPDLMDAVQDRVDVMTAINVRETLDRREPAAEWCVCGCGERVSPVRFAAGCCRTLQCQIEHEQRERIARGVRR